MYVIPYLCLFHHSREYDPSEHKFDGRHQFNRYGSYNRPLGYDGK